MSVRVSGGVVNVHDCFNTPMRYSCSPKPSLMKCKTAIPLVKKNKITFKNKQSILVQTIHRRKLKQMCEARDNIS